MNTTNMTLATLLARLEALESSSVTVEAHTESVNALWVLCAGIMCFLLRMRVARGVHGLRKRSAC